MEKIVVALKGTGYKIGEGVEAEKLTPFIGASQNGWCVELGMGVLFNDSQKEPLFWGAIHPKQLVKSWRAYKLLCKALEKNIKPDKDFLWLCWNVADAELRDIGRIETMKGTFGPAFSEMRRLLLLLVPDDAITNLMLSNLSDKGIFIDASKELEKEILAGRLRQTPYIKEIIFEMKRVSAKKQSADSPK